MSLKKELNSDTCHNMDEPWRHCATEYKPTQNDKHCMIPLTWGTKVLKFTERRSTIVVLRDWGEGAKRSDCLMGTKSHIGMMKSSRDG